jgi:hypothetical protein
MRRWLLLSLALAAPAGAETPGWRASSGFSYSSGDYGTDTRTSFLYVPFTGRRIFEYGHLDLTIPYVSLTSEQGVTVVGGRPRSTRLEGSRREGEAANRVTHSGLGDIVLRGTLGVLQEKDPFPSLDLTARLKAPTADEDKGLGTGEWDAGVGMEFSKFIQGPWSVFGNLGLTYTGDPDNQPLRNPWNFGLGASYEYRSDLSCSGSYEESLALVEGNSNPRDLIFGVVYLPMDKLQISGSLGFGLTSGSPDYTLGTMVSYRLPY